MARNRENMCNYGRLLRLVLLLMTFDLMASLRLNSSVVLKWGEDVQNHILTIAEEGLKSRELQKLYDSANYTVEKKDGFKTVDRVESALGDYFIKKERAARKLAEQVAKLHDEFYSNATLQEMAKVSKLKELGTNYYTDSDLVKTLPSDLEFDVFFKQKVSKSRSAVKISDQVMRDDPLLIDAVFWSSGLDDIFKENLKNDPELRWQNFGSKYGFLRSYPSRETNINFAGFYVDYDPRVRPWYIGATSGPKDIVIILDCSLSMDGKKFQMAKQLAKAVLNTLTKQDFVNVICGHESHWDEVGKWYEYSTEVLSCQKNRLVPASVWHRKDLKEKIDSLKAGGTSEFKLAFRKAFELLKFKSSRTGCQSIIVFVTDGSDSDGESVRCSQGYYTRSGYVPGTLCKYDWSKVWDEVKAKNTYLYPKTRIFSYLTVNDGEEFPGKLACENDGFMKKLVDSEDIISQMQDYFSFLASNTISISNTTWTAPYVDALGLGLMVTVAIPVQSKITNKTIGVVGIDATLEEIENLLMNDRWGSVYAFLINNAGETIFHPLLRPSSELVDDPIFIPISELEQQQGKPAAFKKVENAMISGKTGSLRIPDALRGISKGDFQDGTFYYSAPGTYYYTAINDSVYAFAFNLGDSDKVFRRPEVYDKSFKLPTNYYANLQMYNTTKAREELGDLYDELDVKFNLPEYPNIHVMLDHSTVMLATKSFCNPNNYLFRDNMSDIVVEVHKFINGREKTKGCPSESFRSSVRPDVMITSQMEDIWKKRSHSILKDVRWTYIGTHSGVFRSFPGHRSLKDYDPSRRPWYYRSLFNPAKTAVSNAYMDASGIGKVITISQSLFQGPPRNMDTSICNGSSNLRGGCPCRGNKECLSGKCQEYPGSRKLCAGDRVEAVTALDIRYNDFHRSVYSMMKTADGERSCGANYTCPDGVHICETRCYLVDNLANLVTDPDFLTVSTADEREYERVSLGRKEGDIMKKLVQKHKLFLQDARTDFQGMCSVSPYSPKVTLEGILKTPEEEDDYYKNKGPVPPFRNEYGCIQDVIGYSAQESDDTDENGSESSTITDTVDGPCTSGTYYVVPLTQTNLYLLVIEDWAQYKQSMFYNFNCHISNRLYDAGAFRIVNGTCRHIDTETSLQTKKKCPRLKNIKLKCNYNGGNVMEGSTVWSLVLGFLVYVLRCC